MLLFIVGHSRVIGAEAHSITTSLDLFQGAGHDCAIFVNLHNDADVAQLSVICRHYSLGMEESRKSLGQAPHLYLVLLSRAIVNDSQTSRTPSRSRTLLACTLSVMQLQPCSRTCSSVLERDGRLALP